MKPGSKLTIAISMGDPAGIGPEIIVKALADPDVAAMANWVIVGDGDIWRKTVASLSTGVSVDLVQNLPDATRQGQFVLLDCCELKTVSVRPGTLNADCGRAALEFVRVAAHLAMRQEVDAMVTAPLNKEAVVLTGVRFTGHTEYIAELCGATESRMLLLNDKLRVVHVSTHCSLRQACEISSQRILRTIELGYESVQLLGVPSPRVAVCGLNPHAGESGLFGSEDKSIVLPAIHAAQSRAIDCQGPFPADTLFIKAVRGEFDLVVAMYHDQGHIPMKLLDFENTVNVSLGLPIIRTSVDHGTAFDIAGKNRADARNMKAAMRAAVSMAQRQHHFNLASQKPIQA
jgi:4-phospho-D-threonate 3-dehydrogenase / 4-phospho-D-erythronate 3-dehydrogenase